MGGGLLQLVAMGAQDAYLSGNPQITFWKGLFKRHTNFAMEAFRINFTGQPNWGTKQSCVVNRNADLLYSTYLEVVLPSFNPTTNPTAVYNNDQFHLGYNLLKYAELEIGGQLIDRQYGEWLYLWDTLTNATEKSLVGQQLLSGAGRNSALYYNSVTTAINMVSCGALSTGSLAITGATNAFTGIAVGQKVTLAGFTTITAVNGTWSVTSNTGTILTVLTSTASGSPATTGTVTVTPVTAVPSVVTNTNTGPSVPIYSTSTQQIDVGAGVTNNLAYGSTVASSASTQTCSPGQIVAFGASASCTAPTGSSSGHPNVIYVPLNFFYSRNPGAALPLIALQYHEVKINLLWNDAATISGDYKNVPVPAQPSQASIYVDYIYLDVEERRRMAQESHEYLIEQVQYNEDKGLSVMNSRIDLTFNHPVKELVWVVQPTCYRSCKVPVATTANGVRYSVTNQTTNASMNVNRLTPLTYDQNAVYKQRLQINGQDRFDGRYGDYFNKVQPYQHHTGSTATEFANLQVIGSQATSGTIGTATATYATVFGGGSVHVLPQNGIYCYSFALKPEEHQPSGTCNFSRIDTATLVLEMSADVIVNAQTDQTWDVRVYALNYNILRIMSGMAGLAYSN
jgi:hypothetical protein